MKKTIITTFCGLFFAHLGISQNTLPATGNVGIGTLNPTARLNVNGRAVIDSALFVKDSIRVQKDLIVEQDVRINGKLTINENSVAKNNFKIKGDLKLPNILTDNSATRMMMLDSDGSAREMDFNTFAFKVLNFTYNPYPNIFDVCDIPGYTNNPVWNNGPNKIYSECPEVFVGIGNSAPRVSLDVNGNAYMSKIQLGLADPNIPTAAYFQLKSNNSVNDKALFIIENEDRKLFQVWNHGLVQAREVKIDISSWPDYVFEPTYQLMPLMEVESYINENGHLPNVPDACKLEEDGLPLGEMNQILMEKVEELTLYLIQQQKEIEELKIKLSNEMTKQ